LPLLLVSRLQEVNSRVAVELPSKLSEWYPVIFKLVDRGVEVRVRVYIDRFYNEDGDVVKEYRRLYTIPVMKHMLSYYADLTYFHIADGIPAGYIASALFITFVVESEKGIAEIPVFPNEFQVVKDPSPLLPNKVSTTLKAEIHALRQIGRDVEVVGLLYEAGLGDIASDLVEALKRFYMSDYEGAIKFFRKVVEGLRKYVQSNRLEGMGDNRRELLRDYLSKAYHLISNFGEHSGTYGFMPEAVLSKDIAVSSCRYVVTYLARG